MRLTEKRPDLKLPAHLRRARGAADWDRLAPFAFGAGIIAAGAVLSRIRPTALDLPDATPRKSRGSGPISRLIAWTRDGADHVAPENMSAQLGRSLILAGTAMLAARVLDELAGRDD